MLYGELEGRGKENIGEWKVFQLIYSANCIEHQYESDTEPSAGDKGVKTDTDLCLRLI